MARMYKKWALLRRYPKKNSVDCGNEGCKREKFLFGCYSPQNMNATKIKIISTNLHFHRCWEVLGRASLVFLV